ncbi:Nucleic-acid-binding protein from transposon X-element [Eumeta japonica]|uniref:Nucleic-acid-binding protein from transposon X-element n=1 Tax=Eumeta variegata TaxID=151549 RepID=A0A4C1WAR7_EUMVA|nr:Nucleic-acid-binding protein from transposon X-element [Eumeta japonica]
MGRYHLTSNSSTARAHWSNPIARAPQASSGFAQRAKVEEDTAGSDSTVVGSDDESGSATNTWDSGSAEGSSRSRANSVASFSLVKGKNKKAIRKAVKKSTEQPASIDMDVEVAQAPSSTAPVAPVATTTQVAINRDTPRGANFVKISADCTRLHIKYSKGVRVTDDDIKIICPNVETFRSLNKYLVDNKVQCHTYALEEERKVKAVICGIPVDFALDDIYFFNQGLPVFSVHRMSRRDGSPLWMVLAILERTGDIFNALSVACVLSGIRVEAPYKKGGPGQCHRCQKYGHAAANCHADPRCVKCLVPHWTKECPLTRESEEKPSCVNCGQCHTANYRGCPRAPKFTPRPRPSFKRPSRAPSVAPPRDQENFPALATPAKKTTPVVNFRPVSAPSSNPWGRNQPPRAVPEPPREPARRAPPAPLLRDRVRGSFIVWRRHPNGDCRSPRGFELGDR